MDGVGIAEILHHWGQTLLAWVGFGTLTGLTAKALLPGKDAGGPLATLLLGIAGTVVGCGAVAFWAGHRISPLSPLGFVAATGGTLLLFAGHRLLGGAYFREAGTGPATAAPRRRRVVRVEE